MLQLWNLTSYLKPENKSSSHYYMYFSQKCSSLSDSLELAGTGRGNFRHWGWAEPAEGCWRLWEWPVGEACTWHPGTDLQCVQPHGAR